MKTKEENYVSQYVQYQRGLRFGLWGVWSYRDGRYIKTGSKGEMNKVAKTLNKVDP
jgi:hypothetical protein